MIEITNECRDCAVPGYPCMGDSCPNRRVPHLYCDKCTEEVDKLYHFDGQQLCENCVLSGLEEVEAFE